MEIGLTLDLPAGIVQRRRVTGTPEREASPEILWAEAARRGDRRAFERLYERYARMIHGILLARVSRNDVDDLVQEVFLTAFTRLSTLRDAGAFGSWLAMIARNRAMDSRRRTRRT